MAASGLFFWTIKNRWIVVMASGSDDFQGVSYREFFQVQYNSLREDINSLKSFITNLGENVATKSHFDNFQKSLEEKLRRVELDAYQLKEGLDELEKIVRTNEREILFYRRALAVMTAFILPVFLTWAKGILGI